MPAGKEFDSCGVCSRTILRGERVIEYVTPDRARVAVCSLCRPAAEAADWVPADLVGEVDHATAGRRRRMGLRERLSRASEAARARGSRPERRSEAEKAEEEHPNPPSPEGRDVASESGDLSPERQLRRGIERFNASAEPRKVAGLMRTLGEPRVAVRPDAGGAIVVTVAWELSWYQWEVLAEENGDAVREAGKGGEVSELGLRDRSWNARADGDGNVRLELATAREASGDGE